PPSHRLTQCQALDSQRSATREGSMAPAAARADRLSRHLRQDLAREQLQGRNVFLVEHLEEHPLDAHLLPRLEVGDDALRRAGEERRSVPGRLVRREGGEEGAGGGASGPGWSVSRARIPRAPASSRSSRSLTLPNGTPYIACSCSFQPAPSPRSRRPPERLSTAAAILARSAG